MLLVASDFSFAERAVIDVWIWLWFIQRVWSTDKFACLKWNKLRNFDLKSIITLLIFLTLPVQAIFDVIWTYLKYTEGYFVDPLTHKIYAKPTFLIYENELVTLWSHNNVLLKTITEYILAFDFALLIGTLALMQAFWSHLSSQMGGRPFMRTLQFRFYVGWLIASMIIFPMARVLTSKHEILVENVPQLIFSIQLFIIFLLGIKNGKELNNLLKSIQQTSSPSGKETILRIHYFIEMNKSVMLGTLLLSGSMLILCIDAIFLKQQIHSKFLMDLLLIHANFGSLILWATMILIVYPRYYITGTGDLVNRSAGSTFKGQPRRTSVISLEEGNVSKDKLTLNNPQNPRVTNSATKTQDGKSQYNKNIEKSITSLLQEQKYHIDKFRHKTSASISSSVTATSNQTPQPSPSFPPPPLFPPPVTHENFPTV